MFQGLPHKVHEQVGNGPTGKHGATTARYDHVAHSRKEADENTGNDDERGTYGYI